MNNNHFKKFNEFINKYLLLFSFFVTNNNYQYNETLTWNFNCLNNLHSEVVLLFCELTEELNCSDSNQNFFLSNLCLFKHHVLNLVCYVNNKICTKNLLSTVNKQIINDEDNNEKSENEEKKLKNINNVLSNKECVIIFYKKNCNSSMEFKKKHKYSVPLKKKYKNKKVLLCKIFKNHDDYDFSLKYYDCKSSDYKCLNICSKNKNFIISLFGKEIKYIPIMLSVSCNKNGCFENNVKEITNF